MSMRFVSGDMFASKAEAIINTVNCVGVMGKGVALEFKRRWPENYKEYKKACDQKWLRPGKMLVFDVGSLIEQKAPRFLINFPTKDHWKQRSKIEYIDAGLDALVGEIRRLQIRSLAMPPLGCGNGGLDWNEVRPVIEDKLSSLVDVDIEVYAPAERKEVPEHQEVVSRMTLGRALYIKAIAALEVPMGGSVDRLSLQKVAYFLQELGIPLNLDFHNSLYGPYSDVLKKSLRALEHWRYIEGLATDDRTVHVTAGGFAAADEYIRAVKADESVLERFAHLVQGYSSPYGLELLSTIHYHVKKRRGPKRLEDLVESLTRGEAHRRNKFTEEEVRSGYLRLVEDELISSDTKASSVPAG
ncbi:type II toxin-antitoxin system antitoxin DNA ADP-ribosyl glycohydrolase DarG [Pseudoxanthomonas mexicana]|uniref:type II toxin-antitoxin system antitoxin DNA ADP-ribosyl glycohydrolase DarG n=1 Tax=Pseudoxanthomonas mexicana TaxID=128785 RepID=UPI00209F3579|nr:macro domain-containing protein [Pseudoxanthomonas mexicana]MCP1584384.1 O-acetyl-ADP-ribose deacetylase (regulator of RNase III) [Pseudoxanthomonas mexicana]